MSKSDEWIRGFEEAEQRYYADSDNPNFNNPFEQGTDEYDGFEEGVYTFTQK